MISEFALIEKIKTWIPRDLQGVLPLGDDAAVLRAPRDEELIFTSDALVDGIDFYASAAKRNALGYLSPEFAGRKALAVNLSDLAAMGAKPLACVISLGIPKHWKESWLKKFYRGLVDLARVYQVKCCGGDISSSREFFVSIAMLGTASRKQIVTRCGAKAGDWIGVTGSLGGSLLRKHAGFTPRLHEADFLARSGVRAMMDISDGLLQDLGHMLKASRTGAELEMLEIPISYDAVYLSRQKARESFERACTDGEDFELLFAAPDSKKAAIDKKWKKQFPRVPLSWIGRMTKHSGKTTWLLQSRRTDAPAFKSSGYKHF